MSDVFFNIDSTAFVKKKIFKAYSVHSSTGDLVALGLMFFFIQKNYHLNILYIKSVVRNKKENIN